MGGMVTAALAFSPGLHPARTVLIQGWGIGDTLLPYVQYPWCGRPDEDGCGDREPFDHPYEPPAGLAALGEGSRHFATVPPPTVPLLDQADLDGRGHIVVEVRRSGPNRHVGLCDLLRRERFDCRSVKGQPP